MLSLKQMDMEQKVWEDSHCIILYYCSLFCFVLQEEELILFCIWAVEMKMLHNFLN